MRYLLDSDVSWTTSRGTIQPELSSNLSSYISAENQDSIASASAEGLIRLRRVSEQIRHFPMNMVFEMTQPHPRTDPALSLCGSLSLGGGVNPLLVWAEPAPLQTT